ncbi:MAG: Sec-independent protein translocase protein TatB [Lawsonella sp.]
MFSNIGWGEILVLLVIAVVLLGPERLPDAAEAFAKGIRKFRNWINDAQDQFKDTVDEDFGEDIKALQKPVKEITKIRTMGPKAAAVHYLLDDDESLLDVDLGLEDVKLDLNELTGLNELDKSGFAGMESAEQVSAASAVLGTDSVTEYKKMTHIESAVATDTSAGPSADTKTPPPAPDSPITVGDSWEEGSEEDVEISFDED